LGITRPSRGAGDAQRIGERSGTGRGRQGDLDAVDISVTGGDLDQAEADRIELGIAPEHVQAPARAASMSQWASVDQQAELVGGGLGARGAVGSEVQLVRLDQVLGCPWRIYLLVEALAGPPSWSQ